jgi:hypothetical protein
MIRCLFRAANQTHHIHIGMAPVPGPGTSPQTAQYYADARACTNSISRSTANGAHIRMA